MKNDERFTELDETTNGDFLSIMEEHHASVTSSYPENSFQRIFWTNQYTAASQKSTKHIRWHPLIIKWCILLRHKSQKNPKIWYHTSSLALSARSETTLTHTKVVLASPPSLHDQQLINDSGVSLLEGHQTYICLLGDEMHIKEGLLYNKHSGELVGYCDLGETNNHLLGLEQEYLNSDHVGTSKLASTMMVLMVRSLFTSFTFPYASFASSHLTGEQLVPIYYEALMRNRALWVQSSKLYLGWKFCQQKIFQTHWKPGNQWHHAQVCQSIEFQLQGNFSVF